MGLVLSAATAFVSSVAAVTAMVASAVATAAMAVFSALAAIGVALWSGTVGVVAGVLNGIGLISTTTGVHILSTLGSLNAIGATIFINVSEALIAITSGFKAFLSAIHFHTLINVNNILYLGSSSYRNMMNKVYGELARFSNAIGLGSQFVTLAIRNARNVVLDVSTMVGRGYDLGEVNWINEMNSFFTVINKYADRIAADPYMILTYIDQELIYPSTNLKGQVMQGVFTTIDTILDFSNKTVTDLSKLNTDLTTLVNDLPNSIKEKVLPMLEEVTKPFNTFLSEVYKPNFAIISKSLEILSVRLDDSNNEVDKIVGRLKKPGDLLESISSLSANDRIEQRSKMFITVNTPLINAGDASESFYKEEYEKLDLIADVLNTKIEPTPYNVPEIESPTKGTLGEGDLSDSWYVGDY